MMLLTLVAAFAASAYSQVKETFDSNSWQWTETFVKEGKAYITDGVMRLESKSDGNTTWRDMVDKVATHAFIPMDPTKGFDIKCAATVEKFEGEKLFGIILDYVDDMNLCAFIIQGDFAYIFRMREGNVVGRQRNQFKIQKGKKDTNLDMEIIYEGGELEFRVNDVQALLCKYFPITSNGFGFFAYGKCKVDFDDVEVVH